MKRNAVYLLALGLIGCGDGGTKIPDNAQAAIENYATLVHAGYEDAHTRAESLSSAVGLLNLGPSGITLTAAQNAWLAARDPYLQTEAFRFYGGPIDDPESGPEGLLNAWPLDEAYIDYVVGMPTVGLVNDTSFTITNEAIEGKNELGGEDHISTGYHAVEFLLWGQDLSESGPGARPFTDYSTADNASRRQLYLSTAASGIVSHLAELTDAWAPGSTSNYRNELVTAAPREALRRIFTGLVIFSKNELGGERMVGIETGDQNDEHSCFSDNTTRDFVQDQLGVQNVFLGRYTRIDGTTIDGVGLDEVIAEVDPALAEALRQRIETSLAAAQALVPPYDTEIQPGNAAGHARLEALRSSLQTQGALLEDAMELLGLPFSPPEE